MQKPIELWKEVIQRVTVMGEKVIDPTFGSGTSLAAAAKLGRDFAGCELNPGLLEPALGLISQFYLGDIEVDAKYTGSKDAEEPVPF
jgi:modification methylase